MATISELGFAMIVAEGQLEAAIAERRRWLARENEAREQRKKAEKWIKHWEAQMESALHVVRTKKDGIYVV